MTWFWHRCRVLHACLWVGMRAGWHRRLTRGRYSTFIPYFNSIEIIARTYRSRNSAGN